MKSFLLVFLALVAYLPRSVEAVVSKGQGYQLIGVIRSQPAKSSIAVIQSLETGDRSLYRIGDKITWGNEEWMIFSIDRRAVAITRKGQFKMIKIVEPARRPKHDVEKGDLSLENWLPAEELDLEDVDQLLGIE